MKTTVVTKFSVGDAVGVKYRNVFGKITEVHVSISFKKQTIHYELTNEEMYEEKDLVLFKQAEVLDNE